MRSTSPIPLLTLLALAAIAFSGCERKTKLDEASVDRALAAIDERFGGIPDGLPEDLPIYPEMRGVTFHEMDGAQSISGSVKTPPEEVIPEYEAAFLAQGWTVDEDEETDEHSRAFKKGTRKASFFSDMSLQRTSIVLGFWDGPRESETRVWEPDEPKARAIVDAMAETYADCTTYQDSGTVHTIFHNRNSEEVTFEEIIHFKTSFRRPDGFRFEFVEEDDRYIVHSTGGTTHTFWTIEGVREESSLELALAGATGISSGVAHEIPSMLFEEEGNPARGGIHELKLLEEASFDGRDCHRITGVDWRGEAVTLWIEKETNLLVHTEEWGEFPGFWTEETKVYHPSINVPISDADLVFNTDGLVSLPLAERTTYMAEGLWDSASDYWPLYLIGAWVVLFAFALLRRALKPSESCID